MLDDFNALSGSETLQADICIVGAGIAGLILARAFQDTSNRVVLLESGGRKDETATQQLYRSDVIGLPHDGIHNGRFRVYGGSSTRWGAQLMTLEPHDFESRPHVPNSGWPLSRADVDPWYGQAEAVLRVNGLSYEDDLWDELATTPLPFDAERFHYRFSKWAAFRNRNLVKTIGRETESASNVTTLLHANVVELIADPGVRRIERVRVRSLDGREGYVSAKYFIICCGAIEAARLLLASRSVNPAGIGNDHDLVGRFFQDHISFRAATLKPADRKNFTNTFDPFFRGDTMHSCKLSMTPKLQARLGCVNVMGHVVYGFTEESGLYELRKVLRAMQSKKNPIPSPIGAWRMLRYSSDAFRMLFGQFLAKRRLSPGLARCYLAIDCEQAPSPDSRVMLSEETDALGMPRAALDWRLSEIEKNTLSQYMGQFRADWESLGLGGAEWSDSIKDQGDGWMEECTDTYHHAGTTRMHEDSSGGVVDKNLKVHGIENLYIGSTSVFPSSSCANPTLTMMALCCRLADHLKRLPPN